MDSRDPFEYPLLHYFAVIALACLGGLVKYLNNMQKFSLGKATIEIITSGFTGLMTFWICKWGNLDATLTAFMIAVSGLMGNRAWIEFENFWHLKFGIPQSPSAPGTTVVANVTESANDDSTSPSTVNGPKEN